MNEAVYRDFDQESLEREYSPSASAPDYEDCIDAYARLSEEARKTLECRLDVRYGPSDDEIVDIFIAGAGAPAQIFYHGGYWQLLSHKEAAMNAADFVENGVSFVAVNYALCPDVSFDEVVRQSRAAVAWCYEKGGEYGLDPDRLYLSGHSAGGHLAAMITATDWPGEYGLPGGIVKGITAVSGVYDLEPIVLTEVNGPLNLTADSARRNSPLHHLPPGENACPLAISWGENETAEFARQAREFGDAWAAKGFPADIVEMRGYHHFDVIFELGRRGNPLGDAVYAQMGLAP